MKLTFGDSTIGFIFDPWDIGVLRLRQKFPIPAVPERSFIHCFACFLQRNYKMNKKRLLKGPDA